MAKLLAQSLIRDIPDFPKPGILFKDITPVLLNPQAFGEVIGAFADYARQVNADVIVGIESRGFVLGAPLAVALHKGFAPVRKVGKLPHKTVQCEYSLEYGTAAVEMHCDAIQPGQRVLIVDDLLATGGTAAAAVKLVEQLGGQVVGIVFLVELGFLNGRAKLSGHTIKSFITIPEAKEYQIRVENKEAEQVRKENDDLTCSPFLVAAAREFNKLGTEFHASDLPTQNHWKAIYVGHGHIHYEWYVLPGQHTVKVALHFQFEKLDESMRWLEYIKPHEASIVAGIPNKFQVGQFGTNWAEACFLLKYEKCEGRYPSTDRAPEAARLMAVLIERTWPLIKDKM